MVVAAPAVLRRGRGDDCRAARTGVDGRRLLYVFNAGCLDFAVLGTVGHGLISAVLAALLVGAYRHGRREGESLELMASRIDAAARTFPGPSAFATAILGRLDAATGRPSWITCGHPLPIIVQDGTLLDNSTVRPGVPLGLGALAPVVGDIIEMNLQPGDGVLLYTDGVTESRMPGGTVFGEDRLRDLLAREHKARAPRRRWLSAAFCARLSSIPHRLCAMTRQIIDIRCGG